MKNSKCSDEYNIVKWDSLPYTIQEGQEKPCIMIGDVVVSTIKLNPIVNTVGLFVIGNKKSVKLDSVLHGNIKYKGLIKESSFPNIKNRKITLKKLSKWTMNGMKLFWMIYERQHLMFKDE